MNQQQVQHLFQQSYNQRTWKEFLSYTFSDTRFFTTPNVLPDINTDIAIQALLLGYIKLNENGVERNIAVYEVTLAPGIVLERNRVGLRNLLRKYWKDLDGAFIVFHHDSNPNWRFTYVSELEGFDADGEWIMIKTEPKRYTYVLGESESCKTAAERFTIVAHKGSKTTLDDIKEAFSVEKLSKTFFEEYKRQYELFCEYMTSQPSIFQVIFEGDDKTVRDFSKKMLGRIVFLFFIQKKGWLGVPENKCWGEGDLNFLDNLYHSCEHPELFYSEYLCELFFNTLNRQRPNDIAEIIPGKKVRIPFLNGGLFEEENSKYRNLIFPEELFSGLFNFFKKYNFTIYEDDPNDQTVAVDPEMLGHIFENLLEDNKDKGAYYTPKEIVHYMCQESLIEYLSTYFEGRGYKVTNYASFDKPDQPELFPINEGRKGTLKFESNTINNKIIDRKLIEKLLKQKLDEADKDVILNYVDEFNKALDNVKICDPAIGSGAFPMGLLKEIFNAKQTLYTHKYGSTKGFDASQVKLNIIQKSIYGVDIEKGAVDIARLRFWLSLVVDEDTPKALPNLDFKIVVGNSLVSKLGSDIINIDWSLNEEDNSLFGSEFLHKKIELLKELTHEQKEFFKPHSDKKEQAIKIRNLKIDLLINQMSLMVQKANIESKPNKLNFNNNKKFIEATELYLQTESWKNKILKLQNLKKETNKRLKFFDWKLDFPEVMNDQITNNIGFDIVIGNPPYIQIQKNGGSLAKELENQAYETFARTGDIYSIFYERGWQILKKKGILCYITSNKWMRAGYGEKTREFFAEKTNPIMLIDFAGQKIFSATVDTNILMFSKDKNRQQTMAVVVKENALNYLSDYVRQNIAICNFSTNESWVVLNDIEQKIKEKIEALGTPLKEWDINIYRGVLTGYNEAFIIDGKKKDELIRKDPKSAEIIRPILRGRDIRRYGFEFEDLWLINTHNGIKEKGIKSINVDDYPAIKTHLNKYYSQLEKRADKGDTPYNLRNCAYMEDFSKQKIVWAETIKEYFDGSRNFPRFSYEQNGFMLDKTCFMLTGKYLKFLLGILNSSTLDFYLRQSVVKLGSGSMGLSKIFIEQIPIKEPNLELIKEIEELVTQTILYKEKGENYKYLESQIDKIVFEIYSFSKEEIEFIESQ